MILILYNVELIKRLQEYYNESGDKVIDDETIKGMFKGELTFDQLNEVEERDERIREIHKKCHEEDERNRIVREERQKHIDKLANPFYAWADIFYHTCHSVPVVGVPFYNLCVKIRYFLYFWMFLLSYPYLEASVKVTYWSLSNVSWLVVCPINMLGDGLTYLKESFEPVKEVKEERNAFESLTYSVIDKYAYLRDKVVVPFKRIDKKLIRLKLIGNLLKWIITVSLLCLIVGICGYAIYYLSKLILWPISMIWKLIKDIVG
jgi:hypothetical protein